MLVVYSCNLLEVLYSMVRTVADDIGRLFDGGLLGIGRIRTEESNE